MVNALNTYMTNVPAAKRPAETASNVTAGYAKVGIGALMGVPAIQSSYSCYKLRAFLVTSDNEDPTYHCSSHLSD
jgi:hypothetical protein